jgi:hypothetical protein
MLTLAASNLASLSEVTGAIYQISPWGVCSVQSLHLTTAKVHLPKDFRADIVYSSLNKALEMVVKTDQSMPP